jgi:hypothetical protein
MMGFGIMEKAMFLVTVGNQLLMASKIIVARNGEKGSVGDHGCTNK